MKTRARITDDTPLWAEFVPLHDLTAYELVQAHAVIGEKRTFQEEEWKALGAGRRHWEVAWGLYYKREARGLEVDNIDDPGLEALEQGNCAEQAVALIMRYGGIDGEHHKQWVLDRVLRKLTGTAYEAIVHLVPGYSWSEGIAP